MKDNMKTVKVAEDTHERLVKLGKYNETMNDIIKRMIDVYETKGKGK